MSETDESEQADAVEPADPGTEPSQQAGEAAAFPLAPREGRALVSTRAASVADVMDRAGRSRSPERMAVGVSIGAAYVHELRERLEFAEKDLRAERQRREDELHAERRRREDDLHAERERRETAERTVARLESELASAKRRNWGRDFTIAIGGAMFGAGVSLVPAEATRSEGIGCLVTGALLVAAAFLQQWTRER